MRPLLILRPEPGNAATVAKARQLGLETMSLPLFSAVQLPWLAPDPSDFDAMLFTSANAIRLAGANLTHYAHLPAYCVGQATADAASAFGFSIAFVGLRGIDEMAEVTAEKIMLHLCGNDRIEPSQPQPQITSIVCYRMTEADVAVTLPVILEQRPVAMLHSPRAAQRFHSLVSNRSAIAFCALSPAIAAAAGDGWEDVAISPIPRDDEALNAAISHFNLFDDQGR
jgi:uroporphyrinogen-III synthase